MIMTAKVYDGANLIESEWMLMEVSTKSEERRSQVRMVDALQLLVAFLPTFKQFLELLTAWLKLQQTHAETKNSRTARHRKQRYRPRHGKKREHKK